MSYTCQFLQFGSNTSRVPGYEVDLIADNKPNAPIPKKLVNPNNDNLWDLVFSYDSGGFYPASAKVPGINNTTIQSWYNKEGGGGGPHALVFTPFVINESGSGGAFVQTTDFVDFSQTTPNDNWINTDTITGASVTATVHQDLPEFGKFSIATHATSHSIVITTTTTYVGFDSIFVYAGNNIPAGNTLTVQKAHSCLALAVFKKTTSSSSKEIGTMQFPKIPKTEWPQIITDIVQQVIVNDKGDIYEHLSPRVLASMDHASLKNAIAAISQHVEHLGKVKNVIAGLGEKGK